MPVGGFAAGWLADGFLDIGPAMAIFAAMALLTCVVCAIVLKRLARDALRAEHKQITM